MRFWYFVTWKQDSKTYSGRRDFGDAKEARAAHDRAATFQWVGQGMTDATLSGLFAVNGTEEREIVEGARNST